MADKGADNPREVTPAEGDKGGDLRQAGNQTQEQSPKIRPVAVVRPMPRVTQRPPQPQRGPVGIFQLLQNAPLDLVISSTYSLATGLSGLRPSEHRPRPAPETTQARPVMAMEPLLPAPRLFGAARTRPWPSAVTSAADQRTREAYRVRAFARQPLQPTGGPKRVTTPQPDPTQAATSTNTGDLSAPARRSSSTAQSKRAKRRVHLNSDALPIPKRSSAASNSSSSYSESD